MDDPSDCELAKRPSSDVAAVHRGDQRPLRKIGDLWMVSKGARVTVHAKGEVAVLRTIVVSAK